MSKSRPLAANVLRWLRLTRSEDRVLQERAKRNRRSIASELATIVAEALSPEVAKPHDPEP